MNILFDVMNSYQIWIKEVASKMKKYPILFKRSKWKESRFKAMYKEGLSPSQAFRCWYCAQ